MSKEQYDDKASQAQDVESNGTETVRRFSDDPMYKGLYVVTTYEQFFRAIFESHKHIKRNGRLAR